MKNDEFDRRVRSFFAGAPRPTAPGSLRRLPAPVVETGQGRERSSGTFGERRRVIRGLAGIGLAGLVIAGAVAVTVGVRMAGPGVEPSALPTPPVPSSTVQPVSPSVSLASASPVAAASAYKMGGFAWQEVGVGAFDGVEGLALFPVDQGLLVLGTSRKAPARLWLSPDGVAFEPLDATAFASDEPARLMVTMTGLVKGPAGYVAVGEQAPPMSESTKAEVPSPLVWRSADGLHWSRLSPKGLPHRGIWSIAATTNGYVAVLDSLGVDPVTSPAYTSTDGESWQATSIKAMDLVSHAGHFVALTSDQGVAVSDDGSNWTTLHPVKQVVTVVAGPDGFVGLTYDQATTKVGVIRSPDGRSWTNAGQPSTDWNGGMIYAMGRWVVLGSPIRTSPDGVTWQASAVPYEVLAKSMGGGVALRPFHDGLFAETQVETGLGDVVSLGPLQVHLWFVRAARAGDAPGSTPPPEQTFPPVVTPSGGITEAKAIEIAAARYPTTMTAPFGKLVPIGGMDPKQTLVPVDTLVWAVTLLVPAPACSGKPSGPSPCELPYSSLTVMVDYSSGAVIEVVDNFK